MVVGAGGWWGTSLRLGGPAGGQQAMKRGVGRTCSLSPVHVGGAQGRREQSHDETQPQPPTGVIRTVNRTWGPR